MAGHGFVCAESGRTVRGFHYLDEAAQVLGVRGYR